MKNEKSHANTSIAEKCALSIVVFALGLSQALALDKVQGCLSRVSGDTVYNSFLDDEAISTEIEETEVLCAEADRLLDRQDEQVQKFEVLQNILKTKGTLYHIEDLYKIIDAEIAKVNEEFQYIKSIPVEVSEESLSRSRAASKKIEDLGKSLQMYERNWDARHNIEKNPTLMELRALADPAMGSPKSVIDSINSFSASLPAFIFGKSAAPKDKLEQYAEALRKATRFLDLRNFQVQRLQTESVSRDLIGIAQARNKAEQPRKYHRLLEAAAGYDVLLRTRLNLAQGACLSARDTLENALRIYEIGYEKAPAFIKREIEPAFKEKINSLRSLEKDVRACDIQTQQPRLKNHVRIIFDSLQNKILSCAQKDPSREFRFESIQSRYVDLETSFHRIQNWTPTLREASQASLERIWVDLRSLKSQCEGMGISFL